MQPYHNNIPIGPEVYVFQEEMADVARKMFNSGANEVRVRALPARGYTKPSMNRDAKKRRKAKMARISRRKNR